MLLLLGRRTAFGLLIFCAIPGFCAVPQETSLFDEGIQAFRAGEYPDALRSFLEARRLGLYSANLHYNLGVTFYRLGRYAEAEEEFQALTGDPRWGPIAHYNLGLTAQRLDRPEQALEHFERARRETTDPNLRALATTAVGRLARLQRERTSSFGSLALGYDSNVVLSSDAAALGVSNQADSFIEALAGGSHLVSGDRESGWRAHGGLLLRGYRTLREFDPADMRAGLRHETDSGGLQTGVGAYFDATYVGGDSFERSANLDAEVRGRLEGGAELRGRYRLGQVSGGTGFEYLDGRQQRVSAEAGLLMARAYLRVGYVLELNDRRDFQQGSDFSSYSPTRHLLFASLAILSGPWRADLLGEYRYSRYDDPDRLNGGTLEVRRVETFYQAALRLSRPLSSLWRVFVDYSFQSNESTLDTYDYRRSQVLAGVEAVLE